MSIILSQDKKSKTQKKKEIANFIKSKGGIMEYL